MAADPAFASFNPDRPPTNCLKIWRVENFKLKAVDEKEYGVFYDGDAYVVLYTSGKGVHIFFWIGKECSQDESGTAAYKANELDECFKGIAVQHREVQEHESSEFKSIFKKALRYKAGGVKSGFVHVEIDDRKELYHIKGRKRVQVSRVPLSDSSLNKGDCFILLAGRRLFTFLGSKCSLQEQSKAMLMGEELKNEIKNEYDCVIRHDVLDEEVLSKAREIKDLDDEYQMFLNELGVKGRKPNIKSAGQGGIDDNQQSKCILYRVSDESGTVKIKEVGSTPLSQSLLDTKDSFILEMPGTIFVWKGKGATAKERKEAFNRAQGFLEAKNLPPYTSVAAQTEGHETTVFKSAFYDWTNTIFVSRETYNVGKGIAKIEKRRFDFATLNQNREKQKPKLFDDGKAGTLKIWRVENFQMKELPAKDYGIFYSGDCYVILYSYKEGTREKHVIYYWLGDHSSQDEQGTAALHAREMDDQLGGSPIQVRLVEGKETDHFLLLFDGQMVVLQGGIKSGFRNHEERVRSGKQRLFRVRGRNENNTKAIEVDVRASSLNSNDCFVLDSPKGCFIWFGKNCSGDEQELARSVAKRIAKRDSENFLEGKEPQQFWDAIGGKEPYAVEPDLKGEMTSHGPRLFEVSNASGNLTWEEIFDFDQNDMDEDDIMILDTYDTIYFWIGNGARRDEKKQALDTISEYLKSDMTGRTPENTTFIVLSQGNEPPLFTYHFESWDRNLFEKKKEDKESVRGSIFEANKHISVAALGKKLKVVKFYTHDQLKAKELPEEVDPARKEQYLQDGVFRGLFKMSKEEFNAWPKWKQEKKKKELELF